MSIAAGKKYLGSLLVISLLFLATSCGLTSNGEVADTILVNGKILTVDKNFSVASALAVKGSRIVAVGSDSSIRSMAAAKTRVIDLQGKTVIPGLIDNHMHFIRAVQRWNLQARIDGINSRTEALSIISKKAASLPPGAWLMVQGGWRENQFADKPGGFTLEELDAAAPRNPLFLQQTYTAVYANSLALRAVGVSPSTGALHQGPPLISPQPPYGKLNEQMPAVSDDQLRQNLKDFIAVLNRAGLTSVYDVGRPPEGDITLLEKVAAAGPLPLRVWNTLKYEAYDAKGADAAVELIHKTKPNTTSDYLGMLGLGEHLYLPFFDLPGLTKPYSDDIVGQYMKIATAAAMGGFNIQEHTMLDQEVKSLLGPFEALDKKVSLKPLRWNLAHVLNISDESIRRANALGLTLGVHSVAMYGSPQMQPPIRSIQDSGIAWGLGTDSTIVSAYQPFITLGWVVSGKSINGKTVIEKPVTRQEALIAHTRSNAYLLFKEKDLGTLEAGKFADLVVLDRDYMTIPADDIFNIRPVMTMVGGRVVFEVPGGALGQ
jgi:predicted amidohydrolase YtcJ